MPLIITHPYEQWRRNPEGGQVLICAACDATIAPDDPDDTQSSKQSIVWQAGWRLVAGLGWICRDCFRCLATVGGRL